MDGLNVVGVPARWELVGRRRGAMWTPRRARDAWIAQERLDFLPAALPAASSDPLSPGVLRRRLVLQPLRRGNLLTNSPGYPSFHRSDIDPCPGPRRTTAFEDLLGTVYSIFESQNT
jgi:hypothetical protein